MPENDPNSTIPRTSQTTFEFEPDLGIVLVSRCGQEGERRFLSRKRSPRRGCCGRGNRPFVSPQLELGAFLGDWEGASQTRVGMPFKEESTVLSFSVKRRLSMRPPNSHPYNCVIGFPCQLTCKNSMSFFLDSGPLPSHLDMDLRSSAFAHIMNVDN